MDRWLTNLEGAARLAADVAEAEAAHAADPSPQHKAVVDVARFRQRDVANQLAKIKAEHGDVVLAEPRATAWRTAEEIGADGIIGIYLPATGDASAPGGKFVYTLDGVGKPLAGDPDALNAA